MINCELKYLRLVLMIVGLFLTFSLCQQALGDSTVSAPAVTVNAGQSFSVDISIANTTDLYAFQFDLGFNPTFLSATSISEGPFLPTGGTTLFIPGTIDDIGGIISFNADTLFGPTSGVNGSGALASVDFTALVTGNSPINIFNVTLLDSNLAGINFSTTDGLVTVAPSTRVPEPATAPLLVVGLIFSLVLAKNRMLSRTISQPAIFS